MLNTFLLFHHQASFIFNVYEYGTLVPFETAEQFILTVGHETDEDKFSAGQTLTMSFDH